MIVLKVSLICFSQTGNTRKVARAMEKAFADAGHDVSFTSLKKAVKRDALSADLVGVGAPCFSSQCPTPMKRFLEGLPDLSGKKAFVFATSGGAPGRVLYDMKKRLRKRNARVVGGFLCRGECFHPAPSIVGRSPGRPDDRDLALAYGFARRVAEHAAEDRPGVVEGSRPDAIRVRPGFYETVAAISRDSMLRLMLPAPKVPDPAACTACGWCVSACPVRNIRVDTSPTLGNRCIRCYRCTNGCPYNVFKVNWRLGNMAIRALYNTRFERWFGDMEPGETHYGVREP